MEYEFAVTCKLASADSNLDELLERLGAAGCVDALVGVGQAGQLSLEFVRSAKSEEKAVISALADVNRAIPSARLVAVSRIRSV